MQQAKAKAKAKKKTENNSFGLPKYLRLAKGSMWFDTEGEQSSGVRLFAVNKVFVGRPFKMSTDIIDGKPEYTVETTNVAKDKYGNKNISNYGFVDADLDWYVDTEKIESSKLSKILLAYKHGILIEADPENPPEFLAHKDATKRDWDWKDNGDRIFIGKNKEMFKKLQNNNFQALRNFINGSPLTEAARKNLVDLYSYEQQGYNTLNRPRHEVLELIRKRLRDYGPGMSAIRINEDD